jgi:deazaflavin-dependent oxidoreductase (nitroreductase family)
MLPMGGHSRVEFDQQPADTFRSSSGRTGGLFTYHPMLSLVTKGARTGLRRAIGLAYLHDDNHEYVVVAANAGAPRNPGWYHNLMADPHAWVEIGDEVVPVVAEVATGTRRETLYHRFAAQSPQLELYQAATTRQFPVIVLVPTERREH